MSLIKQIIPYSESADQISVQEAKNKTRFQGLGYSLLDIVKMIVRQNKTQYILTVFIVVTGDIASIIFICTGQLGILWGMFVVEAMRFVLLTCMPN